MDLEEALRNPYVWGYTLAFAGLVLLAGAALFLFPRRGRHLEEQRRVFWSWVLLVAAFTPALLLGKVGFALVTMSAALFACRAFARATGLYGDFIFTALVYLAILGVNAVALWQGGYDFFMSTPIYAVALLCLVPVIRNRAEGMLQRVALAVIAFVYFGFFLAHLTLLSTQVSPEDAYRYLPFLVYGVASAGLAGWAVDRWRGRHPVAARISSSITWEGAAASLLWAAAWSFTLGWWTFPASHLLWVALLASAMLLGPVGLLGDLALRYIERDLGATSEYEGGDFAPTVALEQLHRLLFVAPLFFRLVHWFILKVLASP
jgi:phosphatidate cytidylyltransferase